MKILSIVALAIAVIGLAIGVYCQMEVVPNYDYFFRLTDRSALETMMYRSYGDQKFILGSIALFTGILGVLLGLVTGIKKQKMGWIALLLALVSFVLGAMQSTHMFD